MIRMMGAIVILAVLASPVSGQDVRSQADSQNSQQLRPIQMAKLIVKIPRGEKIGSFSEGGLIRDSEDVFWRSGTLEIQDQQFEDEFRKQMRERGFSVVGDPSNMFESLEDKQAEFLVGGLINHIEMDLAYPNVTKRRQQSRGSASVDVEWQIYSQFERRIVATFKATGSARREKFEGGGPLAIVIDAFGDAVNQLARSQQFASAFINPAANRAVARKPPAGLVPLQIRVGATPSKLIADTVESTALILAAGAEGSGFLIGAEGYVLTNHHVVGDISDVKVRWPDGSETVGEVIRSDKLRDVAIIKTDARGRRSLPLRTQPVTVGEDIYAIGAPTGAQFQNSVTKGIVSASRVFNGYNFIQSDVAVTHGNSGGPIVDAKGQVVGLTDLGIDGAPMLNLFIPIGEALGFLGLQMTP